MRKGWLPFGVISRPALIALFPLNLITPWCQWLICGCGSISFFPERSGLKNTPWSHYYRLHVRLTWYKSQALVELSVQILIPLYTKGPPILTK